MLTGTNNGGNKYSLRVIETQTDANGDATGFAFTIDEWENHDGRHPATENFNWLAIKSGTHVLPDGRIIEAGYSDADSDGETVALTGGFPDPAVILTTVASDNDASNVDSDPSDITASGFTLSAEEAESQDGVHGLEQVGWIAIQPGSGTDSGSAANSNTVDSDWATIGLGGTFTDPVVLAETQTRNDPDTGNIIFRNEDPDDIDLRLEEDTSVDGDGGHLDETLGLVTFEDGLVLCFTEGTRIVTPHGTRRVEDLRCGDPVLTRDNGIQTLRWTCGSTLDATDLATAPDLAPVRIPANAFGPGQPVCDTHVSPQHRLLISGSGPELLFASSEVLAPAKALFQHDRAVNRVRYLHLLFDRHEIVFTNGLPKESFHPGDMAKSALTAPARDELFTLFPDLRTAPRAWGQTARPTLTRREAVLLAA